MHWLSRDPGATSGPNGLVCCDPKAQQCKVQTEESEGTHYYDGEGNRTRFDDIGSGQIIITDYTIGKQMSVFPNLTCAEYCPTEGDFDPSPFWPTADEKETVKDLGKVTVDGVAATHYQWDEKIAIVIKMQETNMYVAADSTGAYATPVMEHDVIEPFGQQLGTEDTHWTGFTAGRPAASLFAVVGAKTCPESPNCGQDLRQRRRRRDGDFLAYAKYMQENNERQ